MVEECSLQGLKCYLPHLIDLSLRFVLVGKFHGLFDKVHESVDIHLIEWETFFETLPSSKLSDLILTKRFNIITFLVEILEVELLPIINCLLSLFFLLFEDFSLVHRL